MRPFLFFILVSFTAGCIRPSSDPSIQKIRQAVAQHMETYPASTLQDLYKNFFQDRFGPGHMIPDTAAARAYLRQELADAGAMRGPYYEKAGYEGNYLRVNLSVLKQDLVPFEVFAEAFCESVNAIQPPSIETWSREWETILETIRSMNLSLPHFKEDIRMIEQLLLKKNYVVHHSDAFVDAYDPHYRILSREIFEKKILPFLKP